MEILFYIMIPFYMIWVVLKFSFTLIWGILSSQFFWFLILISWFVWDLVNKENKKEREQKEYEENKKNYEPRNCDGCKQLMKEYCDVRYVDEWGSYCEFCGESKIDEEIDEIERRARRARHGF